MKITINANVTPDTINSFLDKQYQKKDKIVKFCNDRKIPELQYKDSELEFEYKAVPKVETRPKQVTKEVRKGE